MTLAWRAADAGGCSCPPPGLPADGSRDVPTNARLWMNVYCGLVPIALTGPAGQVALDAVPLGNAYGVLSYVPRAPLAPDADYRIEYGGQCALKPQTFHTGAGADLAAPVYAGAKGVVASVCPLDGGDGSPNCDGPHAALYVVTGGASVDAVAFETSTESRIVGVNLAPSGVWSAPIDGQSHCFRMNAVDVAGNVDTNTREVCATLAIDGGVDASRPTPDAASHASQDGGGGGCALASGAGSPPVGGFSLLAVLGLLRRRRRT